MSDRHFELPAHPNREVGFPTWRELMSFTEKSRRDLDERAETRRRMRPQAEARLAGDTGRLAQLTAGQADILLDMLAYPEAIPGVRLDEELGVPRAAEDVLIGKATDLDLPLTPAAFSNGWNTRGCCSAPAPTPAPGRGAPPRWSTPSTAATRRSSTCSLHVYFATEWHDPLTQQVHDLLESRSR